SRFAAVALPPSPSRPLAPVPAGVVSQPVPRLTFRTEPPSATYRCPAANDTPQGDVNGTRVALAGPPTPPATVAITPATAARAAITAAHAGHPASVCRGVHRNRGREPPITPPAATYFTITSMRSALPARQAGWKITPLGDSALAD